LSRFSVHFIVHPHYVQPTMVVQCLVQHSSVYITKFFSYVYY